MEAPDVAGLVSALASLPDRTPDQLRAYEVHLSALEFFAGDEDDQDDERFDEAVGWVIDRLVDANLSKAARKAISEALDIDWPAA